MSMTDSVMNYASSLTPASGPSVSTSTTSSMAAAAAFYQQQAAASAALATLDPSSQHHQQPLASVAASAAALANVDTPRYPWMSITGKCSFHTLLSRMLLLFLKGFLYNGLSLSICVVLCPMNVSGVWNDGKKRLLYSTGISYQHTTHFYFLQRSVLLMMASLFHSLWGISNIGSCCLSLQ